MTPAQLPTARQLEVLGAIRQHLELHGVPPTIRHLAGLLGIGSTNAVAQHLEYLVKKGLLRRAGAKGSARRYLPSDHATPRPIGAGCSEVTLPLPDHLLERGIRCASTNALSIETCLLRALVLGMDMLKEQE